MTTTVTRLVLARSFDESLDRILGSFIGEGFTIRTVDSGNLCGHGSARRLRYAVLDIVLPDRMRPGASSARAPAVGCRVTLFEFTDGCTLLTVSRAMSCEALPAHSPSRASTGTAVGPAIPRIDDASISRS